MPQTVFTAGNPITSKLKLGTTPDVTTTTALTVRRPDGTVIGGVSISPWTGVSGDEKTAQWYATNDGQPATATDAATGDWLAVWTIGGTGATVAPKVYNVAPLPGQADRPVWQPFLSEVADYVPWLTLDATVPGAQTYLGTFTGNTVPTDEQAQRHVERVAAPIAARWPDLAASAHPLARSYVALRAAANIARAFPRYSGDLSDATALTAQADTLWADLTNFAADLVAPGTSTTATGQVPIWAFPAPSAFGDDYL
jgi:hypothetical protein